MTCRNINKWNEQNNLMLPDSYMNDLHICDCDSEGWYIIRMKLRSKEEFIAFFHDWCDITRKKWRIRKTSPREMCAGLKNVFWQVYHCQSTSYRHQNRSTGCKATCKVTIRKVNVRCRSKDDHMPEYPTIIKGNFYHNHGLVNNNKMFQGNGFSEEIVVRFIRSFKNGYTPGSALEAYKWELKLNYTKDNCDRPKCPDIKWCRRLYYFLKRRQFDVKQDVIEEIMKAEELAKSDKTIQEQNYCEKESNHSELDFFSVLNTLRPIVSSTNDWNDLSLQYENGSGFYYTDNKCPKLLYSQEITDLMNELEGSNNTTQEQPETVQENVNNKCCLTYEYDHNYAKSTNI